VTPETPHTETRSRKTSLRERWTQPLVVRDALAARSIDTEALEAESAQLAG
jgi:hypothetical protein